MYIYSQKTYRTQYDLRILNSKRFHIVPAKVSYTKRCHRILHIVPIESYILYQTKGRTMINKYVEDK